MKIYLTIALSAVLLAAGPKTARTLPNGKVVVSNGGKHFRQSWHADGGNANPNPRGVRLSDGGLQPRPLACQRGIRLLTEAELAQLGLVSDAGSQYSYMRVCDDAEDLEPIGTALHTPDWVVSETFDGGDQLEGGLSGDVVFTCACAPVPGCQWQTDAGWKQAPKNTVLAPGTWRNACTTIPCYQGYGWPSPILPECQ